MATPEAFVQFVVVVFQLVSVLPVQMRSIAVTTASVAVALFAVPMAYGPEVSVRITVFAASTLNTGVTVMEPLVWPCAITTAPLTGPMA